MSPTITPLLSRRVRRLHVRAAAEDDARHVATLLGDALRTASLGAADQGRFVVIRRLPLGRVSARASAASLALHIERVAAEVVADAVAYNLPAASTANAVVFADRGEAIVTLARLNAAGAGTDDWFWPEAVPGWRPDLSRGTRWTLLVNAAHGSPAPAVVAAAVVDRAITTGAAEEFLSEMSQRQATEWLQREGWTDHGPDAAAPAWRRPAGRRGEAVRRWATAWNAADARLVWLATLMSVSEHPACAADPRLPGRIAFVLQRSAGAVSARQEAPRSIVFEGETSGVEAVSAPGSPSANTLPPMAASPGSTADDDRALAAGRQPPAIDATRIDAAVEAAARQVAPHDRLSESPRSEAADTPLPLVAASTAFGGLFFLVPVLERLEFSAFLAANPWLLESSFPARLLDAIGTGLGMPAHDPMALVLRAEAADEDADASLAIDATRFELPVSVRDILATPRPRANVDTPSGAWVSAVRRWCRRYPRIGLDTLVRRRASVQLSRTHVDLQFALSDLDVRIRRQALDVDPGWVPWLGRVITFTYGSRHDAR